jgi:CHAD domain-containing protein
MDGAPRPKDLQAVPMIEREIKFRLPEGLDPARVREAVEAAGFRLVAQESVLHEDRYLDTDDWALYRAGIALRLRGDGRRVRLEAKTLRSRSEQVLERTEWTQDAPADDPPWTALEPGPVAALLHPLAGLRVLERLRFSARLENRREFFRWLRGEDTLGTLTVDRVSAFDGPGTPPTLFDEVEIEEAEGEGTNGMALARRAVEERLGLEANVASKLATALAAAGERTPVRDERAFIVHPADRLVDVAHKTFGRHFGRMLWNEPGARLGVDPEFVHDMRVAIRRLRTAIEVLADAYAPEPSDSFANDLRWVARALGRVRDLDVALERVAAMVAEAPLLERPALTIFAQSLALDRARARLRLIERLDSERFASFVAAARAWVSAGPPAASSAPSGGAPAYTAGPRIVARWARVMEDAYEHAEKTADAKDLHALRIAAKKARYAIEYFGDLEGSESMRRAKRIAGLQDFLGEHQDSVMLLGRMRKYAKTVPRRDTELAMSAGSVLGHLERAARVRRGELRRAWDRLTEA